MKNKVFLDTSFAIALALQRDVNHIKAVKLAGDLVASNTLMVTTQAVVLEIGNSFSRHGYRKFAVDTILKLKDDPDVAIISVSDDLLDAAFELFQNRMDKEWGLVDCVSFVVMRERKIEDALTADDHFIQAGFRALLKDEVN